MEATTNKEDTTKDEVVGEAKAPSPTPPREQNSGNKGVLFLCCFLLAAAVAIAIPASLINSKSSSKDDVDGLASKSLPNEGKDTNETDVPVGPTALQSQSPSATPVSPRRAEIVSVLENSRFGNLNTCDSRAVKWLADVDTWEPPASASDPDQMWIERYFFVCLWFATEGENWNKKENWMDPTMSHCDWYGDCKSITTCDSEGYVQRFCLWINNMVGTLPSQVGALTTMALIEISTTPMTGPLPTELGSLSNLLHLSFYDNDFTGTIPTELAQMTQLTSLFLDENRLSGSIPPLSFENTNITECYLAFENPDTPAPEENCFNDTSSNPEQCIIESNCPV